jgi:hypothetical protein
MREAGCALEAAQRQVKRVPAELHRSILSLWALIPLDSQVQYHHCRFRELCRFTKPVSLRRAAPAHRPDDSAVSCGDYGQPWNWPVDAYAQSMTLLACPRYRITPLGRMVPRQCPQTSAANSF